MKLNAYDEAVIVIDLDSSESDYKEIPLAFLANSPNDESDSEDDDDDTNSKEDASISAELLNPVEIKKEPTTAAESISDETGTCVETTPEVNDSDETGTCPITTTDTPDDNDEDSESDETPKIIMKKTIITDGDSSDSSSEEADIIINPFLPVSDVAEIIKPKVEDEEEKLASDELAFNLIDSNDIKRHADDVNKTLKEEEQSYIQKRFSSFINALMNSFVF